MEEKRLPKLCVDKTSCCGCSACSVGCPVDAIEMRADEEGFLYPVILEEKCIRCYKCEKICPFKRKS